MRVRTLVQWQDPQGKFHEPEEIADVDVFDIEDLIAIGTVERLPDEPVKRKGFSQPASEVNEEAAHGD